MKHLVYICRSIRTTTTVVLESFLRIGHRVIIMAGLVWEAFGSTTSTITNQHHIELVEDTSDSSNGKPDWWGAEHVHRRGKRGAHCPSRDS